MSEVSGRDPLAGCDEEWRRDGRGYKVWRGLVPADAIERAVGGVSQLMARMSARLAIDGAGLGESILFRCSDGHEQTAPLQELAHSAVIVSEIAECLQTEEVYFLGDELSVIVPSASANSFFAADPQVHRFQGHEVASLILPLRLHQGPAELRLVRGAHGQPGHLARLEPDSHEVVSLMLEPGAWWLRRRLCRAAMAAMTVRACWPGFGSDMAHPICSTAPMDEPSAMPVSPGSGHCPDGSLRPASRSAALPAACRRPPDMITRGQETSGRAPCNRCCKSASISRLRAFS